MDTAAITAYCVNDVNAYCGIETGHIRRMPRESDIPPSPFWERLMEMWRPKGLPTSQNGVAGKLSRSQGSTHRWYAGTGYPEIETIIEIADKGDTTVDYLLNGTLPKQPAKKGSPLDVLLTAWESLDQDGRHHLIQSAKAQIALQQEKQAEQVRAEQNKGSATARLLPGKTRASTRG